MRPDGRGAAYGGAMRKGVAAMRLVCCEECLWCGREPECADRQGRLLYRCRLSGRLVAGLHTCFRAKRRPDGGAA